MWYKYVAEFVGVFIIAFVSITQADAVPVGIAVTAMIFMAYNISGAFFNPAIVVATAVDGRMAYDDCMWYVVSHLAAAIAAFQFAKVVKQAQGVVF